MIDLIFADAVDPTVSWISALAEKYGINGIVLALTALGIRKLASWLKPWIEAGFKAYIDRQAEVGASMKNLGEGSLDIQRENSKTMGALAITIASHGETLRKIQDQIGTICPYAAQAQQARNGGG